MQKTLFLEMLFLRSSYGKTKKLHTLLYDIIFINALHILLSSNFNSNHTIIYLIYFICHVAKMRNPTHIERTLQLYFDINKLSPDMPRKCIPHSLILFFWNNASISILPLPLKSVVNAFHMYEIEWLISNMHQTTHAVRMFYNQLLSI